MNQKKTELRPLIPTSTGIYCHLLTINNTKIVINCGLSINFNYSIYDDVKEIIEQADCILLTSFDLSCMGAIGLFDNSIIYCSIPTAILGKIILNEMEHYLGNIIHTGFVPRQVKYSQPFKINGLDIVSYNAGNVIGNSAFRITDEFKSISICYNFNHKKENFLDGLLTAGLENSDILILNSSYVTAPPYTLKARDDSLHKAISNTQGTVIIAVKHSRFFELLVSLSNYKIALVSKNSKALVERVKSMVEWAGSKAAEIIPILDVAYCKISELKSQKVVVVVDDFDNDGYLGSVLERFNNENNLLITISPKKIDFDKLKIYKYLYKKSIAIEETIPIEQVSEESDEIEKYHWTKERSTFFVLGHLDSKDYFPFIKKRRQNNEYGEKVNFQFAKKIEESELKPNKIIATEETEEIQLIKTGIDPLFKTESIDLYGISDLSSAKTVIEGLNPKNAVFIDQSAENALFLASCMAFNQQGLKSHVCDGEIQFDVTAGTQKSLVSEKVMSLKLKKLRDKNLTSFKANRNEELVDIVGVCQPIAIGIIDADLIKKHLIEMGFQVESIGKKLVVNEKLNLEFMNFSLSMESKDNYLLIAIREMIYKYICIV